MTRRPAQSAAAFTLTELLVGMSLAMMVMAAVLSSYTFMGRNLFRLVNQQTLISQSQNALAYLAQDVRMASGISGTPSATSLNLVVPTSSGTKTIAYSYDSIAQKLHRGLVWNSSTTYAVGEVVVYSGTGYRCIQAHSNQPPTNTTYWTPARALLTNLQSLSFGYYDSSGNAYTSATLSAGSYLTSIKQVSLSISSRTGTNMDGTDSPQMANFQANSPRLILRNQAFLP